MIRSFDESTLNKNVDNKLAFSRNNNSRLVVKRNKSKNKIGFCNNSIKDTKKLRKSKG